MTAADPVPRSRRAQPGAAAPGTYPTREPLCRQTVEWADVSGDRECIRSDRPLSSTGPDPRRMSPYLRPGHGDGPETRIGEGDVGLTVELIEPGAVKVERRVAGDPVTASRREPEKSGIDGPDARPPAVEQRPLFE